VEDEPVAMNAKRSSFPAVVENVEVTMLLLDEEASLDVCASIVIAPQQG
jgi:hypothetical protein